MDPKKIRNRLVDKNSPCFIVAEISANHGQRFDRAVELIKRAKEAGVDAVKFQTYRPDTLTINADNRYFRVKHPRWGGQTLYQLYSKAYTPWSWFRKLKETADKVGIGFFSTAFDKTAVDFLEEIGVLVHKISSFELVDISLIEYAAKTKKPLILSTGMSTLSEIKEAVGAARNAGAKDIILLKCISSYPAKPEEMNLRTISDLIKRFGCPVGLSDHTLGIGASVAAISLGANMIEKHFTLSRKIKTPDSFFSIEPNELRDLVDNIRVAEKSTGVVRYGLTTEEEKTRIFRRSLFVVEDVKKGEIFTENNIRSIRPFNGIKPKYLAGIIGKKAKKDARRGSPLSWDMIG